MNLSLCGLGLLFLLSAAAEFASGESSVDGIIEISHATGINGAQDYAYARVEPTLRWSKGNLSSHAELRYEFDLFDNLEPGRPGEENRATFTRRLREGDKHTLSVREMFVDYQSANFSLRVGKQQVVWGEADGLKLLDVLNPQSFTELAFADFDQSRIPLWAANLTWYLGRTSVQLVWQPDSTSHDWVADGGVYALPISEDVRRADAPSGNDVAIRTSFDGNGWNASAYAARRHHDQAVEDLVRGARFPRETLLGVSGSLVVDDLVLRIEARHSNNRTWREENSLQTLVDKTFSALIGVDWTLDSQTWLSIQLLATDAPDSRQETLLEDAVTLTMNRTWNHNKGMVELQAVMDTNYRAGFTRASITYDLSTRFQLMLRYTDIFSERVSALSGLEQTDHMLVGVRVSI